jgi:hypothetical protein
MDKIVEISKEQRRTLKKKDENVKMKGKEIMKEQRKEIRN